MRSFRESIVSKKISVLGAGAAGTAAALFLLKKGAKVLLSEKERINLERKLLLEYLGCKFEEGGHTDRVLSSDLIIASPGIPSRHIYIKKAEEIGIPVMDELELGWRFMDGKLVAITGTNGKSTVTAWTGYILGDRCVVCGNIGKPLTECLGESKIYIVEVSSFQLARTIDFRPDIAIFLNFDQDHLDWHPSLEDYWDSKVRIFKNQKEKDISILNYDDPKLRGLKDKIKGEVLFFSKENEVKGSFVRDKILYINYEKEIPLIGIDEIGLQGAFNIENALVSSLAAYLLGAELDIIKKGLKNFGGLPHRLEFICEKDGIRFYNDSKSTNPHSLKAALWAFDMKVILIAGGEDKGLDFTSLIPTVRKRVKSMIVYGKSGEKIKKIFESYISLYKVYNLKEAVDVAYKLADKGDIVLFSPGCSSFDLFKNYKERGEAFVNALRRI